MESNHIDGRSFQADSTALFLLRDEADRLPSVPGNWTATSLS